MDAEDLAQEVLMWLIREDRLSEVLSKAWVAAVTRNFVQRYWRRKLACARHEEVHRRLSSRERLDSVTDLDMKVSIDELQRLLPMLEARLVGCMRAGATWAEAAQRLGIPLGTRDWLRKRLMRHAAAIIRRPYSRA